jgi:hypothetical protein
MTDQPEVKVFTEGAFVQELRQLVKQHIEPSYEWYRDHLTGPRLCFRFSGLLVVVASITLPVISSIKDDNFPRKTLVLTIVSLGIAILSSLSAFYRWDSTWQSRCRTEAELKHLLANWELALVSAAVAPNPAESALKSTQNCSRTVSP